MNTRDRDESRERAEDGRRQVPVTQGERSVFAQSITGGVISTGDTHNHGVQVTTVGDGNTVTVHAGQVQDLRAAMAAVRGELERAPAAPVSEQSVRRLEQALEPLQRDVKVILDTVEEQWLEAMKHALRTPLQRFVHGLPEKAAWQGLKSALALLTSGL